MRQLAGAGNFKEYLHNPVLSPGPPGSWDAGALGSMSVIKVGKVFHLYYEAWGVRDRSAEDYRSLQIGHAVSLDGIHWAKDPANPVLRKGDPGEWDHDGTWDPFIIYEDGVFKLWYGGGMDSHCDWGYAESKEGRAFVKKGQISHLGNVEDDHVVHDRTAHRYYMYYWDRQHGFKGLFARPDWMKRGLISPTPRRLPLPESRRESTSSPMSWSKAIPGTCSTEMPGVRGAEAAPSAWPSQRTALRGDR